MQVSNLGFAAYLMLNGHNLTQPPKRNANGKFSLSFSITPDESREMFYQYSVSEYSKFDTILVNLKKMLSRG